MKRLLMVTPYPVGSIDMSAYIKGYIDHYRMMGYEVVREKVYFWERKLFYSLKWLFLIRYLLRSGFVYLLHQHTIPGSGPGIVIFLLCARILRRRTIVVSHETVETYAKHLPPALRWIAYLYERMVVRLSNSFIVHTKMHFNEIASFAPVKNVQVIPHPVSGTLYPVNAAKTAWGFYGMLSSKKGVDLLITAYQRCGAGSLPPLRIMGGAAPGDERYVAECKRLVQPEYRDLITFTGFVPEGTQGSLFADIALMIYPYRYISQSGALAETCMCGIPYLAADLPFFADFHSTFGGGRLFWTDSAESLGEALVALARQPISIAPSQRDTIREALSIEKCAARFRNLIEG